MLFNRSTYRRIFLLILRVVTPHHPLQLWKLRHHVAHQVGLAKIRAAAHQVLVGTQMTGDVLGETDNAIGLVSQAAELFLEHHAVETETHHIQPLFAVLGEEKAGEKIEEAVKFITANKLKGLQAGRMGYSTSEVGDLVAEKLAD